MAKALILVPTLAILGAFGHVAYAADDSYRGQTVRLIIATGPGPTYDTWGRLVARHLGRFLPGNPSVISENMPGASGMKAVNYLYNLAPKDGTVIGTFNNAVAFYQATSMPGIQFKAENMSWIGALPKPPVFFGVWHTAGVRTIEDAKTTEVIMGASGAAGTLSGYPALLNNTLGTKFKIVNGYDGAATIDIAMERGEVQGRAVMTWDTVVLSKPEWVREKKIVPILQIGAKRDPGLPDVPLLTELARNEEERAIFAFVTSTIALGQPFAGPPDIPASRLALLRLAMERLGADPAFEADNIKMGGSKSDVSMIPGTEAERIVRDAIQTPPALIEKTKAAMEAKPSGGTSN